MQTLKCRMGIDRCRVLSVEWKLQSAECEIMWTATCKGIKVSRVRGVECKVS